MVLSVVYDESIYAIHQLTEVSEGKSYGQTVSVKVVVAELVQQLDVVQRRVLYQVVTRLC